MKNIGFIIQARTQSTRLSNKIIIPFFQEESILDIVLKNLKRNFSTHKIILATSENSFDSVLELYANKWDVEFFQGEESDVLQRFIDAAVKFNLDGIIRICSDNPYLDMKSIEVLLNTVNNIDRIDYSSFNVDSKPSIKTHFGFWSEFVTLNALKKVKMATEKAVYHEHVTNYIYEHPSEFIIHWINAPSFVSGINFRFTVDTIEDFILQQEIYKRMVLKSELFEIQDLIELVRSNPNYSQSMEKQINSNLK